ncbi:hypothetical protein BGZ96_004652 [Linnemannia gamsii]|uniref:Ubiquitin-domain-containing protein n=1 Tax=Linnemannia gamsii TaxID=64522 RepID=A0ABQ7K5E3_9FUNG|nr:hypothetical protein BGZ96_004652 [Linnemannia gamsii]
MTSSTSSPTTSPSPTSSQPITLNVRASKDNIYPITISPTDTVLHLKERVALASNTASDRIRLVFSGRVLKDVHSIESCNLNHGNVVHMVRSSLPATTKMARTATATPTSATAGAQTFMPFNSSTVPGSPVSIPTYRRPTGALGHQTGFTSTSTLPPPHQNPATHMMSTHTGFGFNIGAGSNGHGMEADMMGQMMQDPTFAQFMSSMLQNPQILESMVATNPMLQAVLGPDMRHILQSPQFQQMVASPDALRQVAQMGTPMMTMNNGDIISSSNVGARSENPITAATTPATNCTTRTIPQVVPGIRLPSSLIAANAPEKRFQVQLQQLSEMGFWDPTKNMRALQVTGGDVNSAIEILCSGV